MPFEAWLDRLADLVFPPRCVARGCHRTGAWLCRACLAAIPRARVQCPACAAPVAASCGDCRRRGPWPFEGASAAGLYAGPLRDAIRALKFSGLEGVAPFLGAEVARAAQSRWPAGPLAQVVAPVPADEARARFRGVDHALLLARAAADYLGLPLAPGILVRRRSPGRQVGRTAAERAANLTGAFACPRPVDATVLLVDDVLTTGATAAAAAAALRSSGGLVRVAVAARAATL